MHPETKLRPVNQPLLLRVVLFALIAAVFTAAMVQYSQMYGRLVKPPSYDDCVYMDDGATHLQLLYQHGVKAFIVQFLLNPVHSPWSTLLAMFSFMVFGVRDWAPYAGNGVVIFAYLAFADYLMRGLPWWQKMIGFLYLLAIRLLGMAVQEFRPDHAVAIATVIGSFLILEKPIARASRRRQLVIGLFFGLALWIKPSECPLTMALLVVCLAMGTAASYLGYKLRPRLRDVAGAWAICLLVAILVAAPYYIVAWHDVYEYIYGTLFGKYKAALQTQGTLSFQFLYYLTAGIGGQDMFGGNIWVILLTGALAGVWYSIRRRRNELAQVTAFGLLLMGTYGFITNMGEKSPFYGLVFQTALVFSGIFLFRGIMLWQRLHRGRIPWATGLAVILTAAAWEGFQWQQAYGARDDPAIIELHRITNGIYNTVIETNDQPHAEVCFEGEGDITPEGMTFMAIRDGHSIDFRWLESDVPAEHLAVWSACDFVVLGQTKSGMTAPHLQTYKVLDKLLELIRQDSQWKQIGYFEVNKTGRGFYLFKHVGQHFTGWDQATGLAALEGPYPEQNLPQIRWGLGPATHVMLTDEPAGSGELFLDCASGTAAQVLTVKLDGKPVFSTPLEYWSFNKLTIPLEFTAGAHDLELDYTHWDQAGDAPRAVIFKQLAVVSYEPSGR